MIDFELVDLSEGIATLFWIPLVIAAIAAIRSCLRRSKSDGWKGVRKSFSQWGCLLLVLFLFAVSCTSVDQFAGIGSFTRLEIWRDAIVLDYPWPRNDVVLAAGEINDVTVREARLRRSRRYGLVLNIHSANGSFSSYVCKERWPVARAVEEIDRFRKEDASGTRSTARTPLPRQAQTGKTSRVLGWAVWTVALGVWLLAVIFAFGPLFLGLSARVFAVSMLPVLAITAMTDSRLHLLWSLPVLAVVSGMAAVWLDVRRHRRRVMRGESGSGDARARGAKDAVQARQ